MGTTWNLLESPSMIFPESSFFKERRVSSLPTPAEIRAINAKSSYALASNFNRPSPVKFPSLGLFVKYGADVTLAEAKTQMMVRERLKDQVPVPEVFGWTEDGDQTFIYMSLIQGDTLQERWTNMNEDERVSVCQELRDMVRAWRKINQGDDERYIGGLDKSPLNDICFEDRPHRAGPFQGADAVQRFHEACGIDISGETPIVFTHDDLVAPNILLTAGKNPKVAAIIDWGQSGWYPAYWEYAKMRGMTLNPKYIDHATQEEWKTKYLPIILDPVDDESCYYPWFYFFLHNSI